MWAKYLNISSQLNDYTLALKKKLQFSRYFDLITRKKGIRNEKTRLVSLSSTPWDTKRTFLPK